MFSLFRKPMKISLRLVLVIPLLLQIVTIAGVSGYLSWRHSQRTIEDLADRLMDETSERISDRLDSYLATPHKILQLNQLAHANGDLDLTDFQQIEERFWQQINVFDEVTAIAFGNQQGKYLALGIDRSRGFGVENAKLLAQVNLANTDPPNTFTIYSLNEQGDRVEVVNRIPNYDPRQRHWYQTGQTAGKQTWTKIVPYFIAPEASLFAVTPMYQNGEFQGVMFVDLLLNDMSRFLHSLDFSPSGQTFIIERSGNLVATSTLEQPFVNIEESELQRLKAIDSQDSLTQKAMQSLREQQIDLTAITATQQFNFQILGDRQQQFTRHFAQITPYQDRYGLDWLMVTTIPESDFSAEIAAHTRNTLWLSLGAMGIAVVVGTAIAQWIAVPIRKLSQNSTAMTEGDFDRQISAASRIQEIDRMAESFNQMAAQLGQSFQSVETALKESETKYATIFHNCPDSIDLTSVEDGRWIDVNDSFLAITGYTREEIIGQSAATFNILVNPQQLEAISHELQTTGVVRNQEVEWRSKSGEIKISLVSCEIIELDSKSYVLSISKEIGEFKRTQTALVESEAKLRQLTENLPIFLGLRTANSDRWLYVSPGFARITGGTVQEMYENSLAWQNYIHPEDREQLLASKPLPYPTEPWTTEFRIVRRDGAIRWLRSTLYPIQDETGAIYRICTISEDISDRKSLQLALQASESKLNEIINTPIAAIVRIQVFRNQDWRLDYISAGSEAIFGYTAEEFIADRSIWMANIPQDDLETTILPVFEDIFQEKSQHFEYRFIHKDGSLRWLSAQFTAKYYPEEDCWFVNQMTVDISDRKQAEIALATQQQREQVLNQVIQNIHQSLDLLTIFFNATRGIAELLELDRAVIVRYLPDREVWRHISGYHPDPKTPDDIGQEIPDRENPFAAQLKQNQVVKIEDTHSIEDPINQKLAENRPGSWLLVPISVNGNIWGSLSIWKKTVTCWSEEQIELSRRITQPLGIAIHQANLYQQSQEAEAALKKSEARYRGIVEDQTELIIRYQADGTLTFVNQAYCRYFGQSPEKLLGHHYNPVIYEDDREYVDRLVSNLSRENPVVQVENRVMVGDEIRWTQWVNRMIFNPDGEFVEVQGVGRDITEIKQAESQLKLLEYRWRTIRENAPSFISMVDRQGRFLFINRVAAGFSINDVIGTSIYDYLTPESQALQKTALEQVFTTGETVSLETCGFGDEQQLVYYTVTIAPIFELDQKVESVIMISTDISDRKQAELALKEAKEAAEAANRAKSEFLANMSHEIRTPLNSILGFSELLSGKVTDLKQRHYLSNIINSGRTLLALINDILDLSKIEAGKLIVEYNSVNLPDLIAEVEQVFYPEAEGKNLLITADIADTVPQLILFDRKRLRQILFNVVGNAIKFTEQGSIKISLRAQPCEMPDRINLSISVADTGIGIAPEQQERIFESFVQSDGQTTRKYGGTGLGLAITQRLTDLLGGTVTLTSQIDQGSTFKFNFPQIEVLKPTDNLTEASLAINLPPEESDSDDSDFSQVKDLPALLQQLEQQEQEVWPELCRTQKQRDLKAFVNRLQAVAEEHQCQLLLNYANQLKNQLDQFDWDNLPTTLKQFPEIRAKLSQTINDD